MPEAIAAMLTAAGLRVHDTSAAGEPPTPYVITRLGVGTAEAHRLGIGPHWARLDIDVLAVAKTVQGCRATATAIRAALAGRRPSPTASPLKELESGPVLTDGQAPADPRYSITIRYRTHVQIGAI